MLLLSLVHSRSSSRVRALPRSRGRRGRISHGRQRRHGHAVSTVLPSTLPVTAVALFRAQEAQSEMHGDQYLFHVGKTRGAARSVEELTKLEEDARAL